MRTASNGCRSYLKQLASLDRFLHCVLHEKACYTFISLVYCLQQQR
jgi:hypothetical protein